MLTFQQLAVTLAERFDGEIINGDALQMYEGLPITTNKIPTDERKSIPHHLLGCVQLGEEPWTVHQFHKQATQTIKEIRARGKIPVLVGGTHYYTQSLLFPRSLVEDSQEATQKDVQDEENTWPILRASTQDMLEELLRVDPEMARRWHPNDRRKIRRSLQIWLQQGIQASKIYEEQENMRRRADFAGNSSMDPLAHGNNDCLIFWTFCNHEELSKRLDSRVDKMISNGLVEEIITMHNFVQEQIAKGAQIDESRGIWIAIGYKEMLPYISNPKASEAEKRECIDLIKIATRQYAKSQARWIRLKMIPAAEQAGFQERVFLLDGTDLSHFDTQVEQKATEITRSFVHGGALPEPSGLNDVAQDMLSTADRGSRYARYCELCDKTVMYEREWVHHLQSKAHKKASRPKVDWKALYPKNEVR